MLIECRNKATEWEWMWECGGSGESGTEVIREALINRNRTVQQHFVCMHRSLVCVCVCVGGLCLCVFAVFFSSPAFFEAILTSA